MSQPLDQMRVTLDALQCGAAMIDRAGVVVHVNPRLCEMLGASAQVLTGQGVEQLLYDEHDKSRIRRSLEHFDQALEGEFRLRQANGQPLYALVAGRPLVCEGQPAQYRVATLLDISMQKAAVRQVAELTDTVITQTRALKQYAGQLEDRVSERTAQLRQSNLEAVMMLAVASEAKDTDTGQHVRRIEWLARAVALEMGQSPSDAEHLGLSAVLHDVGKIHVPDQILKKPGKLTDQERAQMQEHTTAGETILGQNPFFAHARQIARHHHEDWDGGGYPDALAGDDIPQGARIVHLVDVFDALRSERVYKKAWPDSRVLDLLRQERGKQFDPDVVDAFIRLWDSGQILSVLDAANNDRGTNSISNSVSSREAP